MLKSPPANAEDVRDMGSIPGWEDCLAGGMATHPVSYLENPMDRGAWWAMAHSVAKRHERSNLACMLKGKCL